LKFIEIENHLRKSKSLATKEPIFKNIHQKTYIGDDHEPFAKLGVPIVHLTPIPFPKVWHTKDDNFKIVDWMRTTDITLILNVFISVISTS
jgi:glutaminyl-peptide cyclotransferase